MHTHFLTVVGLLVASTVAQLGRGTSIVTQEVDDTDPSLVFSRSAAEANFRAAWKTTISGMDYGGSGHTNNVCVSPPQTLTPVQGPMVVINFKGNGISLITEKGTNFGIGAYAIDGGALTTVDAYASTHLYQQTLFTVSGLANTSHTLSYQVTCNHNAASNDYYQVVDAYIITGTSASPPSPLATSSAQVGKYTGVNYSGWRWRSGVTSDGSDLAAGHSWSGIAGYTISWKFTGSLIEMYGRPDTGDGLFNVLIDGVQVATNVDMYYSPVDDDMLTACMVWAGKVSSGTHTIEIYVTGSSNAYNGRENGGQKYLIQFDEFLAFP
jgi:hypothetical protein